MRWILAVGTLAAVSGPANAGTRPILYDPSALNIGINCQWQTRCMARQRSAMNRALQYVAKKHPPQWRVHLCNRNANRGGYRVDWVGFEHCIRNSGLNRRSR
jgi:hypothetical protein